MSFYYDHRVRLTGMDADHQGICKASALLNHLQVAATLAAEAGGFGREVLMERYGGFWMLARSWYRLDRPLRWEDAVTIRTWHRGGKGAVSYRDYDILVDGERIGEAVAGWVFANVETHKLMRLSTIEELATTDGGEMCKSITLSKLTCPERLRVAERRRMRYSDTDLNGHVNNIRYADFVCDALEDALLIPGRYVSSMQIGYLAECRPGDLLTLELGELPEGHYARGLDETGKARFEASIFFGNELP